MFSFVVAFAAVAIVGIVLQDALATGAASFLSPLLSWQHPAAPGTCRLR